MIHVIIHILPYEIDQLEVLLSTMKRSSIYLGKNQSYHVEVQLNLNLTHWDEPQIPKYFFIDKLVDLEQFTKSWASTNFNWDSKGIVMGCNDARRNVIRKTKHEWIMYLDVDNVFSDTFLFMMREAVAISHEQDKVIIPSTTRMWDTTWDVVTNKYFMDEPAGHEYYDVRDPYIILHNPWNDKETQGNMYPIRGFKFAGWGTTFPTKWARLIDVPDSLGPYGLDDTFLMAGFQMLQSKGYDITQWVLGNETIIENNLLRYNPYRDYLDNMDRREEFLNNAKGNFDKEVKKLYDKLIDQRSN